MAAAAVRIFIAAIIALTGSGSIHDGNADCQDQKPKLFQAPRSEAASHPSIRSPFLFQNPKLPMQSEGCKVLKYHISEDCSHIRTVFWRGFDASMAQWRREDSGWRGYAGRLDSAGRCRFGCAPPFAGRVELAAAQAQFALVRLRSASKPDREMGKGKFESSFGRAHVETLRWRFGPRQTCVSRVD